MTVKVNFVLPANIVADATDGVLLGEFNNWDKDTAIKLKKEKDGSLSATLKLEAGATYQYRYLLNDGRWVNDETAQSESPTENCVITVPLEKKATAKTTGKSTPKKDDLTKIEGIGKKIAELLIAENITTFQELSNTEVKTLQNMLDAAGSRFKAYSPKSWAKQAKLAAANKWDDLKSLQKELKIKKQST